MVVPENEKKVTEEQFCKVMALLLDSVNKKVLEESFEGKKCQLKK